ncbi:MAG: hypothetical protein R3Y56_05935 [Akkermansia sp.]
MKRIKLSSRFGFNLWQIAASLQNWGAANCRFAVGNSNIREFEPILHGIKLVNGSRGELVKYRTGRIYSILNFPDIDMRKHLQVNPLCSDYTIIHVRGTDYLKHMPQHFNRSRRDYERDCESLGFELSNCRVITDDPSYAKHLLPECKQLSTASDLEAFRLLVGARHLIPSGSQFCFWARYLRPQPQKFDTGSIVWQQSLEQ